MFRTALLILSGNATASLLLLARNLIVAGLIPLEDYGIAATFAVVMAVVEMASALGLQQQIVQSKDGDNAHFQAALQGFQVLRGFLAGILLFLIAGPIARFLGIPEVTWAYQLLALVPVCNALQHFDIHRLNRQMRFWPLILTRSVPPLLSLLMVWPLAAWLGDWRVVLYASLAQIGLTTITSHLVAERPYRLVFDSIIMRRSLRFGWPILVNAILLFFVFQGDKLIVGRVLGMESLAIFAIGFTLTLAPTLVVNASVQGFFLPQLSKLDRSVSVEEARFQYIFTITSEITMLFTIVFVFLLLILDEIFVDTLLGPDFSSLKSIFVLLAVLQSVRALKAPPAIVALATGQTENAMLANLARIFMLPLGYLVAVQIGRLDSIIIVAMCGEIMGVATALYLLQKRASINVRALAVQSFLVFLFFAISISQDTILAGGFFWASFFSIFIFSCLSMRNLWLYSLRRAQKISIHLKR